MRRPLSWKKILLFQQTFIKLVYGPVSSNLTVRWDLKIQCHWTKYQLVSQPWVSKLHFVSWSYFTFHSSSDLIIISLTIATSSFVTCVGPRNWQKTQPLHIFQAQMVGDFIQLWTEFFTTDDVGKILKTGFRSDWEWNTVTQNCLQQAWALGQAPPPSAPWSVPHLRQQNRLFSGILNGEPILVSFGHTSLDDCTTISWWFRHSMKIVT